MNYYFKFPNQQRKQHRTHDNVQDTLFRELFAFYVQLQHSRALHLDAPEDRKSAVHQKAAPASNDRRNMIVIYARLICWICKTDGVYVMCDASSVFKMRHVLLYEN